MFGLPLNELATLVGAGYLVLHALLSVAKVINWYIRDSPRPMKVDVHSQLRTSVAVALMTVGLLSIATGWPVQIPQIFVYMCAALAGLFLGLILDLIITFRLHDLSNWLMSLRVPQYRERLLHGEDDVRLFAASQLCSIGKYARPAWPELLVSFKDESAELRATAALAVLYSIPEPPGEEMDVPRAAQPLLVDSALSVRVFAAAILVACAAASSEIVPVLCEGLTSSDPLVGPLATRALGQLGPAAESAIPALTQSALATDSPNFEAADALGKIGAAAVPALIEIVEHGDANTVLMAVQALGKLGEPARAALPALRKLSIQRKTLVSREAKKAIKKLGGYIS